MKSEKIFGVPKEMFDKPVLEFSKYLEKTFSSPEIKKIMDSRHLDKINLIIQIKIAREIELNTENLSDVSEGYKIWYDGR